MKTTIAAMWALAGVASVVLATSFFAHGETAYGVAWCVIALMDAANMVFKLKGY